MKSLLARTFSMHPFLLLAAVMLLPPASAWLWWHALHPDNAEQMIRAAVNQHAGVIEAQVSRVLDGDPKAANPNDRLSVRQYTADQVQELRADAFAEIGAWRKDAGGKIDAAIGELHQVEVDANDRTVDVLAVVNGLKQKLEPALDHVASITAKADEQSGPILANLAEASKELPPALRDGRFLLARSARAMGHVEGAAQQIENAVPDALAQFKIAEAKLTESSENTAGLMANLKEATKPLPKWVRWTFGIGAQVAPTAVGIISGAAAAGAFGR